MMKRILENQWLRLLAGNISTGLAMVGIPVTVILFIVESITPITAGLLVLAIVHIVLIGWQVSQRGTWIPEKWLAAGYIPLPAIDAIRTVSLFSEGSYWEWFIAFGMGLTASVVVICILKNQWRKWKEPKTTTVTKASPNQNNQTYLQSDDPTTMVY